MAMFLVIRSIIKQTQPLNIKNILTEIKPFWPKNMSLYGLGNVNTFSSNTQSSICDNDENASVNLHVCEFYKIYESSSITSAIFFNSRPISQVLEMSFTKMLFYKICTIHMVFNR